MNQAAQKYCVECGAIINAKAEICPSCGVRQPMYYTPQSNNQNRDERWLACLLLCIFLGPFGVHRFYVGKIGTGIIQLLTFGGCGIWYIIDLVMIVIGNFRDASGNVIESN